MVNCNEVPQNAESGVVALWKQDNGYGFITPDETPGAPETPGGKKDVFFLYRALSADSEVMPARGQRVRFTRGTDPQGRPKATRVVILDEEVMVIDEPLPEL